LRIAVVLARGVTESPLRVACGCLIVIRQS
jgi:hypothetical protein